MQLSFRYRFEAAHRFTQTASTRCMTPHGHTWFVTLSFENSNQFLNDHQMVAEFQTLKHHWKEFVHETLDHSYFHHWQDPLLTACQEHIPEFRGLPFPGDPTTELIAILLLRKSQQMYERCGGTARPTQVLIEETPTNSLSVNHRDPLFLNTVAAVNQKFKGWWEQGEISIRTLALR